MTTRKGDPPTAKQAQVLHFVVDYYDEHGYLPTLRFIADRLNIPNIGSVQSHVKALIKRGYLTRNTEGSRYFSLTSEGMEEGRNGIVLYR